MSVAVACLRATILRYFGDPAVRAPCQACSNCRPDAIDAFERDVVRKIFSGIACAGERFGRCRIVAMLAGDTSELPSSLSSLPTTGILSHEPSDMLECWIQSAIAAGLIAVSPDQYRTLSLTARGREVMNGRVEPSELKRPVRIPIGF